jgi:hypothetical protein
VGNRTQSVHFYQLTGCWPCSSVWRDALDIGDLPKLGDDPEPMEKKRKIARDFPIGTIVLPALKIVFKLLDDQFEPQDYDPSYLRDWPRTSSHNIYHGIITASDMFDLPQIVPRFFNLLWQLATNSKESALFVFATAYHKADSELARFAITNFRDLCHPLLFNDRTIAGVRYFAWRFLLRAVHQRHDEKVDWPAVARTAVFPKESVVCVCSTNVSSG